MDQNSKESNPHVTGHVNVVLSQSFAMTLEGRMCQKRKKRNKSLELGLAVGGRRWLFGKNQKQNLDGRFGSCSWSCLAIVHVKSTFYKCYALGVPKP
jgi:hypothetical protein